MDERRPPVSFGRRAVVSFESRRAQEITALITRYGGAPVVAPSMREIPFEDNAHAVRVARALRAGEVDLLVLMTGVGTLALLDALSPEMPREEVAERMRGITVVARGPKPAAVLRELGVKDFLSAPEPNRWQEVLEVLREAAPRVGRRVLVQEHGAPSDELYEALRALGYEVDAVQVYRWALPEDTKPLRRAIGAIVRGEARIALFTSATQVANVLAVAREEGVAAELVAALTRGAVASVGPVCSEALRAEGLAPDIEPPHPKMGHLVKAAAERAVSVIASKLRAD
jgi:uroporphyrinogen-III synthase